MTPSLSEHHRKSCSLIQISRRKIVMSKYVQAAGLVFCLGLFGGCSPEVADPVESEFQGEDAEAQMRAMEAVGAGDDTDAAQ